MRLKNYGKCILFTVWRSNGENKIDTGRDLHYNTGSKTAGELVWQAERKADLRPLNLMRVMPPEEDADRSIGQIVSGGISGNAVFFVQNEILTVFSILRSMSYVRADF